MLPLRGLIVELKPIINIPEAKLQIKYILKGIENLAKVYKHIPRTIHTVVKQHRFMQALKDYILLVKMICTIDQLLDIFTIPLARISLEH